MPGVDLRQIGHEDVKWIELTKDGSPVTSFRVP
jgi:hypothetical protein